MNLKRLSPFAIPNRIRLLVVMAAAVVLTYVLLVSDPTRIFRWLPFRAGKEVVTEAPDWAQHFIAYLTFSFLLRWYSAAQARWVVPAMFGFAVAHAMATEYLQRFVPERTSDLRDFAVNMLGIVTGTILGRVAMWLWNAEQSDVDPALFMQRQSVMPLRTSDLAQSSPTCGLSRNTFGVAAGEIQQTRVLNFGFLGGVCAVGVVLLGAIHVVHGWQVKRHAGALMELGRKAQDNGDLKAAKDYFGRYVGLVPKDVNALADFGQLLDQSGAAKRQVFMVYEDVLRRDATREEIRRRQIEVAMDIGRHVDALVHVRFLRMSYPTDGKLDYQAGRCLEELAEFTDAMKAYEAALEHDPDLLDTYVRLAWLSHTRLDRTERAKKLLDELVARLPKSPAAWLARGRFRGEFGSLEEAQQDVERAMKLAPDEVETLLAAARLSYDRAVAARGTGRDARAQQIIADSRQLLQQGIEKHPDHIELRLQRVQLEAHFGSPEEAQRQIDKLLELSPRDVRAQIMLADVKLEQGQFESAKTAIDKLPRTPGSDALRLFLEGRMLMSQAKWPLAVAKMEEARRISTQASGLIERTDLALAQCHAALDDVEAETAALRRVLKSNPVSIPARLGLAACLLRQQKLKEAIAEFRPLVHLPQVRLQLVRLLIMRNLQLPELARDWAEIERLLDQSKTEQEDPVNETLLRAELLAARGQAEEARRVIEEARTSQTDRVEFWIALSRLAERSGDSRQANLWMGQALSIAGDATQAEELLRQTLDKHPTDFSTAFALMQHLVRHNKRDDAKSLFAQWDKRRKLRERPLELAQCLSLFGEDDEALGVLQSLLKVSPNDFAAMRAIAELHLRHQRLNDAELLLSRLLDSEATVPASDVRWARRQLAVIVAAHGDSAQRQRALKLLERNERESAMGAEDLRTRAFVLASSARSVDQQQAVTLLSQLADRQQLQMKDRWLLGRLFEQLGQNEEAELQFRQVLAAAPDRTDLLAEFVHSLIRRGALSEAAAVLKDLQHRVPASFATLAAESRLLAARGDFNGLSNRLQSAAKSANEPSEVAQLAVLSESLSRETSHETASLMTLAEKLFRHAATQEPRYVFDLVRFLSNANRHRDAFAVCLSEWSRLPTEAAAPLALSLIAFPEGRAERMLQLETKLLNAIEQQPRSLTLQTNLADLRCWQERYTESEELYRRVLNVDRHHVAAANNLAWLLAMRGKDLDDAHSLIERLIDRHGSKPNLLDTRGCVLLALHRAAAAVPDFRSANDEVPSATTQLHLAIALHEAGDAEGAKNSLAQARQFGINSQTLHPLERPWLLKLEK